MEGKDEWIDDWIELLVGALCWKASSLASHFLTSYPSFYPPVSQKSFPNLSLDA